MHNKKGLVLIQNTTMAALMLSNADTVFMQFVDFDANQQVLNDSGSKRVAVTSSQITNTPSGALTSIFQTQNTRAFEISQSTIENNSFALLDATFTTVDSYSYGFGSNVITSGTGADNTGDVFQFDTQASANGATLALVATGNQITLNDNNTDAFDITWNGPISTIISGNSIFGVGDTTTGVRFNSTSLTDLASVTVQSNVFQFDGAAGTGVNVVAEGPSLLTVSSNTFDFNGLNGVGMRLSLLKAGSVGIYSNFVNDDGSGATAVLIPTIADLSTLAVENNLFQFNSTGISIDRGIIIDSIPASGTISLSGNVDNVMNGATPGMLFVIPAGQSTGGIPVNGVFLP